ncbi:Exonuclease 1 [Taenia crassiceps]|uniref:Exonuclease 1 n=1 Tax=Taenia crassiceps TaxID=6207 RepID=A0ABR4QGT4_9CEST
MVLEAGVRPILVFDGANLPAKAETEAKRRRHCLLDLPMCFRSRKMYRERAAQYLLEGDRKAAQECFERCVEVTAEMARSVIKAARKLGVDCIIAPYESDAQLAYLVQSGYADLVITEDSDLLMFGCKQVIFKLNLSGSGTLITWSAGIGEKCCGIASKDFSPANLRYMGILSGCDYFPGIPRIGLATAAKIMRQSRAADFRWLLLNLGNFCNLAGNASSKFSVTSNGGKFLAEGWKGGANRLHEDTIRAAMRAERTFRLQVVFDPRTRRRLRLSEPTIDDIKEERLALLDADMSDSGLFSYAGEDTLDSELAFAIAVGNVDFETGKKVDTFNPDNFKVTKLFNGFRAASDEPQGMFISSHAELASSVLSMLKRACRPDGQRLNISIWSTDYKLEPVWLYFTETGIRPRPFCISVENQGDSQRLDFLKLRGSVEGETAGMNTDILLKPANLPRSQLKLGSGEGLCRNDCVIVPSCPTSKSTIVGAQKRPLDAVLASYASHDNRTSPKTPLKEFSGSETPITSANSYFASPVSATIPASGYGAASGNLSSPIFRSKRSRSLFTVIEPELVSRTSNPASPLSNKSVNIFASQAFPTAGGPVGKAFESQVPPPQFDSFRRTNNASAAQAKGRTPRTHSGRSSISAQCLVPTSWGSGGKIYAPLKHLPNGQQLQRGLTSGKSIECNRTGPPSSPIYDVQTVCPQQARMTQTKVMISPKAKSSRKDGGPNLSSIFSKWRFTASRRSSLT